MTVVRLVLGDQLSRALSSLHDADQAADHILMCEVREEATYARHHKQKLVLVFAAMRRFADALRQDGFQVRYVELDDPANTGSFAGEVGRALQQLQANRLILTEPSEYRVLQAVKDWDKRFGVPVTVLPDTRFLCRHRDFQSWLGDRRQPRMEYFYREMRRKHRILIDEAGQPEGGQWNFDKQNRIPLKTMPPPPAPPRFARHARVDQAVALVERHFPDHFGTLDHFHWPTAHDEALLALDHFIDKALPHFGAYQDNMATGQPFLFHAVLSAAINLGLLDPLEVCRRAEQAYRAGSAPLNAAEGFIRQILGWREYVRGIYWAYMPRYAGMNHLGAKRRLPSYYWDAVTDMHCVAEAVRHTRDYAYSHHIQRLMVTGNFALLAGLDVAEVCDWYLSVYADAYDWVELPNTLGMALFGDGGIMGSKPYAASGRYIDRMSDFCRACRFDPKLTVGEAACPFNALYWDFIDRHRERLRHNPRMGAVYVNWDRMDASKQAAIKRQAALTLAGVEQAAYQEPS